MTEPERAPKFYVEIRRRGTKWRGRKPMKRMGPVGAGNAERLKRDAEIGIDHKKYRVEIVRIGKRKAYFAAYHKRRYSEDPEYKERMRKRALDWQRRARAAARGDITPWLEGPL